MADSKIDAYDVGALERAVNDSASRVSGIWLSFVAFSAYVAAVAANVTHRQLFLDETIKLPTINVDLPLFGSAILLPALFVIFHIYLLMQVVLLSRTADAYNDAVERALAEGADRTIFRQRLANTLFAQIFAGSPRERSGALGAMLVAMAWITLAFGPVCVLALFLVKFLPYHSAWVTWVHRVAIFIDLIVLLVLWRSAIDPKHDITWRTPFRRPVVAGFAVVLVVLSIFATNYPGEPQRFWSRAFSDSAWTICEPLPYVTAVLPENFDRISLPGQTLVDDDKLSKIARATAARGRRAFEGERTKSYSGRDLSCAVLTASDLRRADFSDADLFAARLDEAELEGAVFARARMQRVKLLYAQIQGASFEQASMHGASLYEARAQGATFAKAQLVGADLSYARLHGALFDGASLLAADFGNASLQGGSFVNAAMIGSTFTAADLRGTYLNQAQLQGTLFRQAKLSLASFTSAQLWRTRGVDCNAARIDSSPNYGAYYKRETERGFANVTWTPESVAAFITEVRDSLPVGSHYDVTTSLRGRLAAELRPEVMESFEESWRACARNPAFASESEFDNKLAAFLRNLACDAPEYRKLVAEGIVAAWLISERPARGTLQIPLAKGLLGTDGADCAASKELSERTREQLRSALTEWERKP